MPHEHGQCRRRDLLARQRGHDGHRRVHLWLERLGDACLQQQRPVGGHRHDVVHEDCVRGYYQGQRRSSADEQLDDGDGHVHRRLHWDPAGDVLCVRDLGRGLARLYPEGLRAGQRRGQQRRVARHERVCVCDRYMHERVCGRDHAPLHFVGHVWNGVWELRSAQVRSRQLWQRGLGPDECRVDCDGVVLVCVFWLAEARLPAHGRVVFVGVVAVHT